MKISVIITTHKRPVLLERAVRSVAAQVLPTGITLELIIHDDDASNGEVLTGGSPVLRCVPNSIQLVCVRRMIGEGGVARARNRALAVSSGEWVLFLDDDDALAAGALDRLLTFAVESGADFCAGGFKVLSEGTDEDFALLPVTVPEWSYESLMIGNLFPIGSFIMKRSCVSQLFNPCLATHEDWLFLLDNLGSLNIRILPQHVLNIFHCDSRLSEHRNERLGAAQKAGDYLRIYSLYPSASLFTKRLLILQSMGGVSLERLLLPPEHP
jgi:glycosyltransferase involved in cell wall biosynthesis